jgi:putative protease
MRPLRSELLMPAGSLEKLKIAVLYGADAVYMGTPDLSLRVKSQMSLEQVREGVLFARQHNVRSYLTLNLFSHNRDIDLLEDYLETLRQIKPDGVIVADTGVFQFLKLQAPEFELHISTQANVCSWLSVQFWESMGAKLIVLAREVSFEELKEIRKKCPDIRLETFIHGAMCMTYSGRCLLSNYMAERGANQGSCANSCRWHYKMHIRLKDGTLKELEITDQNRDLFEFFLEEEHRGGELLPFEEDQRGSYILNAKDLCLLPKLPDYLALGIDSLKVEGRGRSAYYLAITTRTYRMAIDEWYESPETWSPKRYMDELLTIPNKGYSLAFHEGRLTHHAHNYDDTQTLSAYEFAGIVEDVQEDHFLLKIKNRLESGDILEFIPFDNHPPLLLRLYEFDDVHKGTCSRDAVHAGQNPLLRISFSLFHNEDMSVLRQIIQPYVIVRKERLLSVKDQARLQLDRIASGCENGQFQEELYQQKRQNFVQEMQNHAKNTKSPLTPRLGPEACCGRGCNGCLPFWHDPLYAKARTLLKSKKKGMRLDTKVTG